MRDLDQPSSPHFTDEDNQDPKVKETPLRLYNKLMEEGLEFYLSILCPLKGIQSENL